MPIESKVSVQGSSSCLWKVLRADDNGNLFIMAEALTAEEAEIWVNTYQGRGHKQTYWAEAMTDPVPPPSPFD